MESSGTQEQGAVPPATAPAQESTPAGSTGTQQATGSPQASAPDLVTLNVEGQTFQVPRTDPRLVQWAQQGYHFSQRMEGLTAREQELQELIEIRDRDPDLYKLLQTARGDQSVRERLLKATTEEELLLPTPEDDYSAGYPKPVADAINALHKQNRELRAELQDLKTGFSDAAEEAAAKDAVGKLDTTFNATISRKPTVDERLQIIRYGADLEKRIPGITRDMELVTNLYFHPQMLRALRGPKPTGAESVAGAAVERRGQGVAPTVQKKSTAEMGEDEFRADVEGRLASLGYT